MEHHLNYRQRRFINYFIEYGNGSLSASKAGYEPKFARQTANRLLTNKYIQSALSSKFHYMADHSIATSKEIYQFFTKVLRGKVTEDIVLTTADGEIKDQRKPLISDRLSAGKELMKRYAPIEQAKAKKLNAEAKIKAISAKHSDTKDNNVNTKVDELLDAIFDDKKRSH